MVALAAIYAIYCCCTIKCDNPFQWINPTNRTICLMIIIATEKKKKSTKRFTDDKRRQNTTTTTTYCTTKNKYVKNHWWNEWNDVYPKMLENWKENKKIVLYFYASFILFNFNISISITNLIGERFHIRITSNLTKTLNK